jgi:hypothetical protein
MLAMRRLPHIIAAVLALVLAVPTAALASGSLLSGYAGPGGGEQTVVGGKLLPPAHGNGSVRAQSKPAPAPIPTPSATPPVRQQTTTPVHSKPAAHHHATTPARSTPAAVTPSPAPTISRVPPVALATAPPVAHFVPAADTGAGFPLSGSALLFVLVALAGVAATMVGTRRLSRPGG